MTVYDSLGTGHTVDVYFRKTADNAWEYHAIADGSEITGGTAGTNVELGTGAFTFTTDGALSTVGLRSRLGCRRRMALRASEQPWTEDRSRHGSAHERDQGDDQADDDADLGLLGSFRWLCAFVRHVMLVRIYQRLMLMSSWSISSAVVIVRELAENER
jgi:hypothetical protein